MQGEARDSELWDRMWILQVMKRIIIVVVVVVVVVIIFLNFLFFVMLNLTLYF